MQDAPDINPIWQIAPLVVLLVVVALVIWRGMGRDADSTDNKAKGGGSHGGFWD